MTHSGNALELKQIAHDIRSPLTALSIALATAEGLTPEQRALLAASCARLEAIAAEILGHSPCSVPLEVKCGHVY